MNAYETSRGIDTAETAKLVRAALKRAFPTTKFSVRIERYSMGSSVNVTWTDGPTTADVEAITDGYRGKGSMDITDYVGSNLHWLFPDGSTVLYAGNIGNWEGTIDGVHFAPGAELVHFHNGYVSCTRCASAETRERLERLVSELTGKPYADWTLFDFTYDGQRHGGDGGQVVHQLFCRGV